MVTIPYRGLIIGLTVLGALPAHAQTQAERLAQMMSKNYSMQSLQALMLGDSEAALEFALRAFPLDPTDQEAAALLDAMFALELASGSRVARIEAEGSGLYSVDPTGTRAFVGFYDPRPEVNSAYVPPSIYDPRDGALIKVLEPISASTWPERSPVFSPDGGLLAYPTMPVVSVQLFNAADGSFAGEMTPSDVSEYISPVPLGFSGDGRQYAYGYLDNSGGILVWNVADQTLVSHLKPNAAGNADWFPLGWDHEDGFAVQKLVRDPETGGRKSAGLERWHQDGKQELIAELDGVIDAASLRSFTFPDVPVVFMTDEVRLAAVDLESGEVRFTTEVSDPEIALVRNGTAFAIRPFDIESLDDFQVIDLHGNRLQPTGRDLIPLAQAAVSQNGMIAGVPKNATRHTYQGQELPQGAALYDQVWAGISDEIKRSINQDRVMRP